ncbi:hypothetical protein AB0C96_18815 [Streptomyces sp. NPDC048506]
MGLIEGYDRFMKVVHGSPTLLCEVVQGSPTLRARLWHVQRER